MDYYHINANDLSEEEVNYELAIRGYSVEGTLESRRRTLRNLFRGADDCIRIVRSPQNMVDDFQNIPTQLQVIERMLAAGPNPYCFSRLVHYHLRVSRYHPDELALQEKKKLLVDVVRRIAYRYFQVEFPDPPFAPESTRIIPPVENVPSTTVVTFDPVLVRAPVDASRILKPSESEGRMEAPKADGFTRDTRDTFEGANPWQHVPVNETLVGKPECLFSNFGPYNLSTKAGVKSERLTEPLPIPPSFGAIRRPTAKSMYVDVPPSSVAAIDPLSSLMTPKPNGKTPTIPPLTESGPTAGNTRSPLYLSEFANNLQIGRVHRPPRPVNLGPAESRPLISSRLQDVNEPKPALRLEHPQAASQANRLARPNIPPVELEERCELIDKNEYVHVSEIESYIRTYVNKMLNQSPRPPMIGEAVGNNLADQIARGNINDVGGFQISSERIAEVSLQPRTTGLPLQPSGRVPERHSTPVPGSGEVNIMDTQFRSPQQQNYAEDGVLPGRPTTNHGYAIGPRMDRISSQGYPRRLPHQQCAIIEKWPKFSGDTNAVPVTDFLRQLDILCRSYAISRQELRMHAHLLFKDSAYVWYTTYEEKFDCWETLEFFLKMRYDNPNRDRVIREEMRNRKQRPNELFSAFLTDMEMLAQRLIRKMSEREKFEIVVDNMKLSYRRRLALEEIYSIEHLAQLCFRFDALETNLYATTMKPSIHQISAEENYTGTLNEAEEEELIYALQSSRERATKNFNQQGKSSQQPKMDKNVEVSSVKCWNCQRSGHMWRECDRRKTIFCHICGQEGTTAYRCPMKHKLQREEEDQQKND